MAFKPIHLLSLIIILVIISPIVHSARDISPTQQPPIRHHFIKDLQGCQKGDSIKGLNKLKHYLKILGYLHYSNQTHLNDNIFDESLEAALRTYQENYNIIPSGVVDAATVSKMILPRCGVPDIINGVNTMRTKDHNQSNSIGHTVMHYSFFPTRPRWPPSKRHLTYSFDFTVPNYAKIPVAKAFGRWQTATSQYFTFSQAQGQVSDLVIGFYSGAHGDGFPFDGPSGILAHAFAPTDGRLHYDADEVWGFAPDPFAIDLESVALHEIGHLLGLDHSSVAGAAMYPVIPPGGRIYIREDDLAGIVDLYNL